MYWFLFVDCSTPIDPANGQYFYTSTTFDSILTLTCDPGYVPSQSSVVCNQTGHWNDNPTCDAIGEETI